MPTIRDLLEPPASRPKTYYRGNDIIDPVRLGFVYTMPAENGVPYTVYDTSIRGNRNDGHLWGTQLPPADKDAIVEYMKMF